MVFVRISNLAIKESVKNMNITVITFTRSADDHIKSEDMFDRSGVIFKAKLFNKKIYLLNMQKF